MSSKPSLKDLINELRLRRGLGALQSIEDSQILRKDLDLDSLDLAVLMMRLQEVYGVDIFAAGGLKTVADLKARIS